MRKISFSQTGCGAQNKNQFSSVVRVIWLVRGGWGAIAKYGAFITSFELDKFARDWEVIELSSVYASIVYMIRNPCNAEI